MTETKKPQPPKWRHVAVSATYHGMLLGILVAIWTRESALLAFAFTVVIVQQFVFGWMVLKMHQHLEHATEVMKVGATLMQKLLLHSVGQTPPPQEGS